MPTVYATFADADAAGKSIDGLIAAGFPAEGISLSVSNLTRDQTLASAEEPAPGWTGAGIPEGALVVAVIASDEDASQAESILRRGAGTLHPA